MLFDQFRKLFALLDFEKSNSQNDPIYNFHASKNPDATQNPLNNQIIYLLGGPAAGAEP